MGRLKSLPPRIGALPSRLPSLRDAHGHSRDEEHWRGWYNLKRWRDPDTGLRMRVFIRDLFTCQLCGKVEHDTSKLVADHKREHRGDPALFWNEDNVQTLCKPCHDADKQAEEAARRVGPGLRPRPRRR